MKIGIAGTGRMGTAIALRLAGTRPRGHSLEQGTGEDRAWLPRREPPSHRHPQLWLRPATLSLPF